MTTHSPSISKNAPRLRLEGVTLCAVSSSNLKATVAAVKASLAQIEFAQAMLFTNRDAASLGLTDADGITVVAIDEIRSSEAYSRFLLERLADHITTSHCLIVQWDGHVIDAARWQDAFLEYDYIGASWPQFDDGHDVGNGGFSLRSHRLMKACQQDGFHIHHPEDVAIGRTNRAFLEQLGLRFAPKGLADQFSAERSGDPAETFGYHGVFLMPGVLGVERFWSIYNNLSDKRTLRVDFRSLLGSVFMGAGGFGRAITLLRDRLSTHE